MTPHSQPIALFSALLVATSIKSCLAWQTTRQNLKRRSWRSILDLQWGLSAVLDQTEATTKSSEEDTCLKGVQDFESWFSKVPGSGCDPSITHACFGNLRGLGTQENAISSKKRLVTIPRSVVLESDFSEKDWDVHLSQSLWKEVLNGSSSRVAGYVSLLTKGSSWRTDPLLEIPPSTAPDALRHWTADEKAALAVHREGQHLLDLQSQQEKSWKEKFKSIDTSGMTWEQFEWAMEAVHSRSFCGDFGIGGGSPFSVPVAVASPVVAALTGYIYYIQLHGQNDAILLGLATLAALPSAVNLLKDSPPVAVLLPLIDSANHREEADSSIEYIPLTNSFELTGGSKCLVTEATGNKQLYISYGKKTDAELLLNYGFLKGVSFDIEDTATRRMKIAEQFIANRR